VECTPVFYRKIGSMVGRHAGGMRRADGAINTTQAERSVVLILYFCRLKA